MSSTPSNSKSYAANAGLGLKTTTPSTVSRSLRSPNKTRSIYESGLSLKSVIGTTVSSPRAIDSLPSSRIYAYTAGATAIVVNISPEGQCSQRFYRARPTAVPANPPHIWNGQPSTPSNLPNDSRSRTLRESSSGYMVATPSHAHADYADSPTSKTWSSRERIKANTCVSISPDGNFLAVGETGYTPRVLIFCLQHNSSDSPLSILTEHMHGVRAVAFSPDSKFLATLGYLNDGFIYIWSINPRNGAAKLHSSNKCTCIVKEMVWMGSNIVTVGQRHVKVWRVEDGQAVSPTKQKFALDGTPQPIPIHSNLKTLSGRNVILGPLLLDTTFTCVATIFEDKAILCTDKGDICLLDDSDKQQRLSKIGHLGFGATCIAVDTTRSRATIGGRYGRIKTLDLDEVLTRSTTPGPISAPESPCKTAPSSPGLTGSGNILAMAAIGGGEIVSINSKHAIGISSLSEDDTILVPRAHPFTAHSDNVLGVKLLRQPNLKESAFFTWSTCGTVLFWDLEGHCKGSMQILVEQDDDTPNQCRVVRASKEAEFFLSGDKSGMLRITDASNQNLLFSTKAHGSEIQDIDIFEGETSTLVASCGRDRTVQLYKKLETCWVLVQTMDEHTASVCCVSFCENGEKLISSSTDRTIQIRQLVNRQIGDQISTAAIPVRTINFKASPVSMTIFSNPQTTALTVSLQDRSVATYDVGSGRLTNSFRAISGENEDAVVMDSLVMGRPSTSRPTFLAGVSSTDKSVRVYEGTTGFFLDREWGHTSSVTDVALLEDDNKTTLISTGSDGTIMIWSLSARIPDLQEPFESPNHTDGDSPPKELTFARQPVRKVLSKAELAEFQRSSPNATPTGKSSPPQKVLRKKPSKYGLSAQPSKKPPPTPIIFTRNSFSEADSKKKNNPRARSRSPARSPRSCEAPRPSLANSRNRTKSTSNLRETGSSLNVSSEEVCKSLRAYRKKLKGPESVKQETLKELDLELKLTAKALGERALKSKAVSETLLAGLLDQYSERLVSMFDEKLKKASLGVNGPGLDGASDVDSKEDDSDDSRVLNGSAKRRVAATD